MTLEQRANSCTMREISSLNNGLEKITSVYATIMKEWNVDDERVHAYLQKIETKRLSGLLHEQAFKQLADQGITPGEIVGFRIVPYHELGRERVKAQEKYGSQATVISTEYFVQSANDFALSIPLMEAAA